MDRFVIKTLGCKVNQCETDSMAAGLKALGWVEAGGNEAAALCIVNTCAVTGRAAMQSRQAVRQALRQHPGARVVVTGCYAQTEPGEAKRLGAVASVVGHADKHRIPELIGPPAPEAGSFLPEKSGGEIQRERNFRPLSPTKPENRSRPFLKIQDGCSAFCSYCIVPHARGPSRSMPLPDVLAHLSRLKVEGFRETVLSGIHLGCYGLDLAPPSSLLELLRTVVETSGMDRFRLSSIEPAELSDGIPDLAAGTRRICRHFHIPLQSGDDRILRGMNRPYTADLFRGRVFRIKKILPDAAIGADVMIGFPGEDQAAFENTLSLVEALPLSYLHVFPFSPRKGTPAARFPEKVADGVVKERCRLMRETGAKKRLAFYREMLGKTLEVLVEGKKEPSCALLKGISSNYVPVFFSGPDHLMGALVKVEIESVEENLRVLGRLCP